MPRRLWVLLAPLLTAVILLASSSDVEQPYMPSVSVEDAVAAFYLSLSSLLALGIFSMRRELAEAIRELFRREPEEEVRGRRTSLFWLLVNILLLAVAYFLSARSLEEHRREAYTLLKQAVNASLTENLTQAAAAGSQPQAILAERAGGVLAPYAPLAALAALLLAFLSVALALAERQPPPPRGSEEGFRESFLREVSTALESLRLEEDARRVIIELYYSLCRELRRHGVRVTAEMTAREIMREATGLLPGVPPEPLEVLTLLFEKAAYSDHPLQQGDKEAAERALARIVSSLEEGHRGGPSGEG
ncbi:MAG: DUF4129 domain-containing protein [Thermofilum sp.]|nr:DUF4129 domain-containing protein [Thermofilum sp.]